MAIDPKGLLAQVQANHRALEFCPDHDFQREERRPMPARYRCSPCGAEASLQFVSGYQQGRAHGPAASITEGAVMTVTPSEPAAVAPTDPSITHVCSHGYDPNCTACEPLARLRCR